MFPGNKIEANVTEDTVVLTGHVTNLRQAENAEALAAPYGKKVINLLEVSGGQQVMLQVRVAEVSKTAIEQLGVNWGLSDNHSFYGSNTGNLSPLVIDPIPNAETLMPPHLSAIIPNSVTNHFGRAVFGRVRSGRRVGFNAVDGGNSRIYRRDNKASLRAQVTENGVTRPQRIRPQISPRDPLRGPFPVRIVVAV